jgi:nucleoside-diphosphate-sugar epimerase
MDVLVVGGTGLISTGITRQLHASEHDVTVANRGETEADIPAGVPRVTCDRTDPDALADVAASVDPDCVIDMVCFTPGEAREAVEAFAGVDQYVFCSTIDVYHRPTATYPTTEDSAREPGVSEYGREKAAAEDVFRDAHGDAFATTILRPWHTYGEGGRILHTMGYGTYYLDRIREGKPILVHGDGTSLWAPCHRDDVARAFVAAVGNERAYGEAYHVTSEESMTWNQYHGHVASALDAPDPDLVHVPTDLLRAVAPDRTEALRDHFQYSTVFDNAKARRDLEFAYTVDFETGVERTVAWLDERDRVEPWDAADDDRIIDRWRAHAERFVASFE